MPAPPDSGRVPDPNHEAAAGARIRRRRRSTLDGRHRRPHFPFALRGDRLTFLTSNTARADAPALFPLKQWTHAAGVFDGTEIRIYVGGVEVARGISQATLKPDATAVLMGGNRDFETVQDFFTGALDDVRLYNRALSAAEIATLAAP